MTSLDKSYEPSQVEPKWLERWAEQNAYQINNPQDADFAIALPPPNVTGELHMGHALNGTLQDVLVRYNRMLGKKVHWQIGCDHAGIGTQIVVEKQLAKEGKNKYDLGRQEFEKLVWDWTDQHRGKIEAQMKLLGCSPDWSKSEFTLNPNYVRAVRKTFFEFFKEGLIYQGTRLINWCPHCLTSLSDLEVVYEDRSGKLYKIKYPFIQPIGELTELVVATSRPETLFGDVAIAINPADERYRPLIELIQKEQKVEVVLPLTHKTIPVILSEAVKLDFGTGALKITPAHDFNDAQIVADWNAGANLFKLPLEQSIKEVSIFDEKAFLLPLKSIPTQLWYLERFKARERTLELLRERELLLAEDKYTQPAALHDRCGTVIEPYLSKQWFVKMSSQSPNSLDKLAIGALKQEQVSFYPERYGKTYLDWLENIQDWCISRQLWWGHQIPVWSKKLDPAALADSKRAEEQHEQIINQFKVLSKEVGFLKKPDLRGDAHHPSFFTGSKKGNQYIFQYDTEAAQVVLLENDEAFEDKLKANGYTQDPDVLDTWFSSALWPFAAQGWPGIAATSKKPWTNVLITAREIINLWVSRMIYSSLKLTERLPFSDILIHPVIQTPDGKRMSKSKGNAIDPIALVDKYGADASRLWYCSVGIFANQDTRFPGKKEKDGTWISPEIESKRRFINKLWNATKFVMGQYPPGPFDRGSMELVDAMSQNSNPADLWILGRWNEVIKQANEHLENYRFAEFSKALEDFVWDDFCDWYLELVKASTPPAPLTGGVQDPSCSKETHFEHGGFKYNQALLPVAEQMRKNPTKTEETFWNEIIRSSQTGFKFIRQKPIGNFILDFYCSELLLGIEVDGEVHEKQQEQDKVRTETLNAIGIEIIRFSNDEVLNKLELVRQKLQEVIQQRSKSSSSLCQGGEGGTATQILEQVFRALHPVAPFVTEELWSILTGNNDGLSKQPYPKAIEFDEKTQSKIDEASQKVQIIKDTVQIIRSIRQKTLGLSANHSINAAFDISREDKLNDLKVDATSLVLESIVPINEVLKIAKAERNEPLLVDETVSKIRKETKLQLAQGKFSLKVLIEVPAIVDLAARKGVLGADLNKKLDEKSKLEVRFNNPGFMNNASEEAKAELKTNLERINREMDELNEALTQIGEACN
jgi:valyl-tRNA synthetase